MGHALPIDLGQLGLNVTCPAGLFAKIDPRLGWKIRMYGQLQLPQQSGLVHAARSQHFDLPASTEAGWERVHGFLYGEKNLPYPGHYV
jgi:hypothetical protein